MSVFLCHSRLFILFSICTAQHTHRQHNRLAAIVIIIQALTFQSARAAFLCYTALLVVKKGQRVCYFIGSSICRSIDGSIMLFDLLGATYAVSTAVLILYCYLHPLVFQSVNYECLLLVYCRLQLVQQYKQLYISNSDMQYPLSDIRAVCLHNIRYLIPYRKNTI